MTTIEPSDPVVPPPLTPAIMKPIEQVMQVYPGIEVVPVLQAVAHL